jgi:hypothetical protein
MKLLIMQFSPTSFHFMSLRSKYVCTLSQITLKLVSSIYVPIHRHRHLIIGLREPELLAASSVIPYTYKQILRY